ncbi:hypothetical protein KBB85_02135 [Patescibacteria group bacterium]|nr:hypothetical protein [Patescibacteria group bacterium]
MKLSRPAANKRLQELLIEAEKLTKETKVVLRKIQGIKKSLAEKKDLSKVDAIRKQMGL